MVVAVVCLVCVALSLALRFLLWSALRRADVADRPVGTGGPLPRRARSSLLR